MKKTTKIITKIFIILIFLVMIFYTFNNSFVYASNAKFNANDWVPNSGGNEEELIDMGNKIIGPLQVLGSLVSVVTIIIIGIKYMLGSVEEKSQYKETLGPYFLGAVLVFGIINVATIIYDIASALN